jgi:hypothetical protein
MVWWRVHLIWLFFFADKAAGLRSAAFFILAPLAAVCGHDPSAMISIENLNQVESIKKRAGHLWRFL